MSQKTQAQPTSLLQSAIDIMRQAVSGKPFTNQAQLARATGESEANISRWLSGASTPTLRRLEPVLMTLGVRFTLPGERTAAPSGRQGVDSLDRRPDSWGIWNNGWLLTDTGEHLRCPLD